MKRILAWLGKARRLSATVGNALSWLSPALARLAVGLVFLQTGWGKLHDLGKVTQFFTQLGLPVPAFQAVLVASTELVCGSLLLIGLATRLAVLPLIVIMVVAIRTAQWSQVDSLGSLVGLTEFLYITLLVWIGTNGPGPISADWLLDRLGRRRSVAASEDRAGSAVIG